MTGIFTEGWSDERRKRLLLVSGLASAVTPALVLVILAVTLFTLPPPPVAPVKPTGASGITRVFAADGRQIAALRAFERFIPVEPAELPPALKEAVLAIEDQRFDSHNGVDIRAVFRAFWTNLNHGRIVQGGSTITQQYVKQAIMPGRERTFLAKAREAITALRLERTLSKDEILYRYLSTVYFGAGAYGAGAAADTYFRKHVSELTLSEAALLAATVRSPTALNPRSNPSGAELRRQVVLDLMLEQDRIGDKEYQDALQQRVVLAADASGHDGPVTLVYPPRERHGDYPYFVDYVQRYLVARYGEDEVLHGGLRVETSLDPALQEQAEAAVEEALAGTDPRLGMSLVAIDPGTGLVRALVGGRDFSRSQVNLALGNCPDAASAARNRPICLSGGGSGRQPGSSFKPFVLARALEEGIDLDRVYRAPARYTFPSCRGAGCTVRNAGGGGYGSISLRRATAYSVNTVFAQLIRDVGVKDVAELAHRLGLTTIDPDGRPDSGDPYGPSLALGAAEVSPLDMAAAYAVFANRGVRIPASPVVRVTTADGEVLEDNSTRKGRRVLAATIADDVTAALRGAVDYGTGGAADIGQAAVAGKTGTAENHSDAWFVGFTPQLSAAVWMGHSDSRRPLENIKGERRVYGGTIPARTWARFMRSALATDSAHAARR